MDATIHAESPTEQAIAEKVAARYRHVTAITVLSTTISVTSSSGPIGDVTTLTPRKTDDLEQDLLGIIRAIHVTPHE